MAPLTIDVQRLQAIATATTSTARPNTNGGGRGGVVSAEVLAETKARYPECQCEERVGLAPGIPVAELMFLNSGCTSSEFNHGRPGWVCPRLDTIRRRYGK